MYYDDDVRFSGPVEKTDTRRVFVLNVELKRHDLSLIKKKNCAQVHDTPWQELCKDEIWMYLKRGW